MNKKVFIGVAIAAALAAAAGFSRPVSPVEAATPPTAIELASYTSDEALWNAARCYEKANPGLGALFATLSRGLRQPDRPKTLGQYPFPPKTALLVFGSPESSCYASDVAVNGGMPVQREYFSRPTLLDDGTKVTTGLVELAGPDHAYVLYWIEQAPVV